MPDRIVFPTRRRSLVFAGMAVWCSAAMAEPATDVPASFSAVGGRQTILTLHGVGAQVYECKPGTDGALAWTFREPVATLVENGNTVGRHYAGPNWDLADGSGVTAKATASQPAPDTSDIPLLQLQVVAHRGAGALDQAGLVLRLHTVGGTLTGACAHAGELKSVPYAADYLFLT